MSDTNAEGDHKAPEVQVIYERNQLVSREPFTGPEQGNVHGPATADVSFSVQSMSGESHMMSDAKPEDASHQVPSLAYWAEQAQEELDKGRGLNINGLHTVVCIDVSDSMKHGAAWKQAGQFFTDFIEGLEKVKKIVDDEFVALTVFGHEVKVVQQLTSNYISLQEAFRSLKLGGPTPLYGGLLMALAGVASVSIGVVNGVRIPSRVILVTDGHLTDPLLIAGSDVCDPDKDKRTKNQITAMQAVQNISSKSIRLDCVPVGKADLKFLTLLAASAHGKVYSYKDGGKLARRTVNSCHAGHVLNLWKMMRLLGHSLGTEISLEDVMDISEFHQIASLSQEEKEEVLEIAKESSKKALKKDDEIESQLNLQNELEKYHYEFDDPAVQLPPLGTRVRRGPDWKKGREDDSGPGTIIGHHKNKRQVRVEWDRNGKSDFYCYGDQGKYDVTTVNEPRVLQSKEKIATGCRVRRGKDWMWENQDGAPGTNGVVIKVRKDGWVWVRWPDKTKNMYRFDTDGKFDLEICPVESQTAGVSIQPGHPSSPESRHETDDVSFSDQASSKTTEEGMVEQIEACTSAAVITASKSFLTETTHPTTTSTILLPTATCSTSIAPTATIMVATTSTASTVTSNTVVTSECTSSLEETPVMVASSETSANSLVTTASSLATITIPATTLHERTSTPLTTSTLLTSSASATASTPASVMTSINTTIQDTTNEDNLDVDAPVSRVPKTSHWKLLAHKELVEAQRENTPGIHTVICVDISASMRQRSAWEQTQQFFNEFFNELEKIKEEFDFNEDQVALSVFGHEVKVVQRLSKNYTHLQQAFSGLKLGGPTPMYGGLQMALAGLASPVKLGGSASKHSGIPVDFEEIASKMKHGSLTLEDSDILTDSEGLAKILETSALHLSELLKDFGVACLSIPIVNGIQISPRIILITDGHLTDSLLLAGPDVQDSDVKAKTDVMKAVKDIAEKKICIHCVPVGDADVPFLKLVANKAGGQIISFKDGRNLARRTINTFHAGHIIEQWKSMNEIGKAFGTEVSLEEVMDMPVVPQIASLSQEDKEEILHIAREALDTNPEDDDDAEINTDHYEHDDSDVSLPSLGTRVRRGPDWDKGFQDNDGPGTIVGHHKDKKQVKVEWDKTRHSCFCRYGDMGQYDVLIDTEPRVLQSELIATGCLVRRGEHWNYDNQDGTPGAIGVVLKVKEDGIVVVRWPNKSKNYYRYGAEGCFFDLEICHPDTNSAESMKSIVTHPEDLLGPGSFISQESQTQQDAIQKYHTECLRLPPLGTRVRRGVSWNKSQEDHNGPGTIIGHNEEKSQVYVEWDGNGQRHYYYFEDKENSEVVVVDEPRVLQPCELIVTGCHVKQGTSWMYGDDNGTPDATGVVLDVREDGMVLVRWKNKFKCYYRFGAEGQFDLEICKSCDNQIEQHMSEIGRCDPTSDLSNTKSLPTGKGRDKNKFPKKKGGHEASSRTSIHEQTESNIVQEISHLHGMSVPEAFDRKRNIVYKKKELIGRGFDGTYVYRGKFDERDVAVKRLLKENFIYADQEVKLLRESDQHPNVIRYFWMEDDADFICIALELCQGNLQDYVEDKLTSKINIEPTKLLHQALSGLAHLHSLGIVHRDIKPQNILISKPSPLGEVRAMISDFGFSKKLPSEATSFSSRSNVLGTEGWMSPEMLKSGLKKTTAMDIFSAGCVIHYVLTKGLHPFGKRPGEIQDNILEGKFTLDSLPLTSDGFIAKDIIKKMLSADPKHRPTAKGVLNHLLFWTKTEKLQFIEATSDWNVVKTVQELEKDGVNIVRSDWTKHLSQELQNDIQKDVRDRYIRYRRSSVKDLLRLIRNKRHHYNKMAEDVRKSIGSPQDEYLDYFTTRFPLLLLHIYHVMECCAKEDTFKTFYKPE